MPELSPSEWLIVLGAFCFHALCLNGLLVAFVGGLMVLGFHVFTTRKPYSDSKHANHDRPE